VLDITVFKVSTYGFGITGFIIFLLLQ
jgi:hypothetical protein